MNLVIIKNNDVFDLKGTLDRYSVFLFRKEFNNIFEKINSLTINIENLDKIDKHGLNALVKLHNEAITKGKSLSMIGLIDDDLDDNYIVLEPAVTRRNNNFQTIYELQ